MRGRLVFTAAEISVQEDSKSHQKTQSTLFLYLVIRNGYFGHANIARCIVHDDLEYVFPAIKVKRIIFVLCKIMFCNENFSLLIH